jgi:thiamine biosynthesis lipoprotein
MPPDSARSSAFEQLGGTGPPEGGTPNHRCAVPLRDEAISVSAVWGKSFEAGGETFGHVLDPRHGRPVKGAVLAAVVLPSATETDALSTALLVLGTEGHGQIFKLRPGLRSLVIAEAQEGFSLESNGILMENSRQIPSQGRSAQEAR